MIAKERDTVGTQTCLKKSSKKFQAHLFWQILVAQFC